MATEENNAVRVIPPRRLWFGYITSAVAWAALGCIDILINWRACIHQQQYETPDAHPGARLLIGGVALVLLAVAIVAGSVSYRNWRQLTRAPLLGAEAVERQEFMALLGVIVTATLGMGILWLAIPPLFLDLCWRAH